MSQLIDYSSGLVPLLRAAEQVQTKADIQHPLLFAVDGRCGSGKSCAAAYLSHALNCPVFHMDDFFLPPELRTPERLMHPGENVHHERFLAEIITPFLAGRDMVFRPFDCRTCEYGPQLVFSAAPFAIVEGSYALHPKLRAFYAGSCFLTCNAGVQEERLLRRVGAARFASFKTRWIPLEEQYFAACRPDEAAGLILDTGSFCAPPPLC